MRKIITAWVVGLTLVGCKSESQKGQVLTDWLVGVEAGRKRADGNYEVTLSRARSRSIAIRLTNQFQMLVDSLADTLIYVGGYIETIEEKPWWALQARLGATSSVTWYIPLEIQQERLKVPDPIREIEGCIGNPCLATCVRKQKQCLCEGEGEGKCNHMVLSL